jgi:hypothetical protein|tara:strand:- start:40 stop:612 length:573 start_codon:yes stop_codon:yes gene_type:complete
MKLDITINFKNGYSAITDADNRAKGEKGDCVVRAVMNAFEIPYNGAHRFVANKFNRKRRKGVSGTAMKFMSMVNNEIANLNGKKVVHLGSHPKHHRSYKGKTKILLNKQYPIIKKSIDESGELVIENTFAGFTVGKFIQQHQKGTFLILVAGHALAVKDGVMLDNGNHNDDLLRLQRRDQRRCQEIFQIK